MGERGGEKENEKEKDEIERRMKEKYTQYISPKYHYVPTQPCYVEKYPW
jgi:hypothetical protein